MTPTLRQLPRQLPRRNTLAPRTPSPKMRGQSNKHSGANLHLTTSIRPVVSGGSDM